jgi:hypothetical protein
MKRKFNKTIVKPTGDNTKDILAIFNMLQTLSDDLSSVIDGKLSMSDGNLPFQLYKRNVTSGVPFEVTGFSIAIVSSSSNCLSFKTNLLNFNLLQVTITLEEPTSDVIFLIITESAG